jgi:hypothetical protein
MSAVRAALAALLMSAGCSVARPGEWDPAQCRDGLDNDGDGLVDCADADCWAFACGPGKAGGLAGAEAGSGGQRALVDAGPPPITYVDARVLPPPFQDNDAGDLGEDAGPPPSTTGCGATHAECASDEECVGGQCVPGSITGSYVLEVLSAVVPARTLTGTCWDTDVFCALSCDGDCRPDPYVRVTKNSVLSVGATSSASDTTKPTWTNARFDVSLTDGDTLVFGVWDSDMLNLNMDMYSCSPDLATQVPTGMLRCTAAARATIPPGADGAYEVLARITRSD